MCSGEGEGECGCGCVYLERIIDGEKELGDEDEPRDYSLFKYSRVLLMLLLQLA